MNLPKDVKKVISELKKNKRIKAIYLFGSYAKGTQNPLSDIDICVITQKKINENEKIKILSMSSEKIDISFFWDLPIPIRYAVFKEGKLLFVSDKLFLHRIKSSTILKYLDFQHIINRQIEITLGIKCTTFKKFKK